MPCIRVIHTFAILRKNSVYTDQGQKKKTIPNENYLYEKDLVKTPNCPHNTVCKNNPWKEKKPGTVYQQTTVSCYSGKPYSGIEKGI